ncbi:MAG TPA: sigma-70 family RNA polymerase sigma factor [Verrucomicrobiae bacterium]|jgi:RNA polymerase sigma factor (sigma-70 family)
MSASDLNLLGRFARENSQDAFTEIVRRHVDLVYSAALRQVRSPQLAEEVAQSVFSDLARDAGKLRSDTVLIAWLYAVTRRTAIDVIRKESRRQLREQIAMEMNTMNATANDWTEIGPLLDDAMAALDESDRSVILLRFFENKSLREVGESLSISDDAAQKRAGRAVEQLRGFFSKRRLTIGASGLAVLISANAVQSAPVGLAATISTAAVLTGAAAATASATLAATKIIAMTTLQKTVISAALAATIGTAVFAAHKASQLREQNQALQQQQAPLAQQIQQLQQEFADATNRVAGLLEENALLKSNSPEDELLELRNEVTQLHWESVNGTPPAPPAIATAWANWNNQQNLGSFYAIAGTPTETVAAGIDGRIATRDNASGVWKIQTFTGDPDFRAIVYANNQYVVVRESGSIMTSPDGLQWTNQVSPTKKNLLGIFWDGHQYLAGGDQGTILSSPDGINWTSINSNSKINFYGFSYSGTRYVAVGNDGIWISDDSITWAPLTNAPSVPFTACVWTGSEFLACGLGLDKNPTIYTSPDGDVWTLRDTTITASLRTAVTVGGAVYVSGDSVIEKSTDGGTTWTNTINDGSRGNKLLMGLASNGDYLIAAGFNHNIWAMPLSQ